MIFERKQFICRLILFFLFSVLVTSCNDSHITANSSFKEGNIVPVASEFQPASKTLSKLVNGQTVYVPVYSSIHNRYESNLLHLTAMISIRNISPREKLIISQVDYYDTNGKLIKKFINQPFSLSKMATKDFVIPEFDLVGGTGANFVVKWNAERPIATPIIETVMIGEIGTKGFSFTSRGKEIENH